MSNPGAYETECAWCGKSQSEVGKLIVTVGLAWRKPPTPGTSICDECVELCMQVLAIENKTWRDKAVKMLMEQDEPEPPDSSGD